MRRTLEGVVILVTLVACAQAPVATSTPQLPTLLPTRSPTPTQTSTLIPTLAVIILPTPTTYTYTVEQGDTLSSIADKVGVSLQALEAANPGNSPTTLTVGTKLVIPTGAQAQGESSPTPAALPVKQAHCWPEATGGTWCFALLQNSYSETLENISAQFTLLDASGRELSSQIVYGLLDILPAVASMPLAAHFDAPVPPDVGVRVTVLTAIRLLPGDTRYLPVSFENNLVSVDATGKLAEVSGKLILAVPEAQGQVSSTDTAKTVWVLATAYDSSGNVVGVRRWESPSALTAGAPLSFDFPVSSVGPEIARVEFLAEARP